MTSQDSSDDTEEEAVVLTKALLGQVVDEEIRDLAETLGVSKADVIRYLIHTGLEEIKKAD